MEPRSRFFSFHGGQPFRISSIFRERSSRLYGVITISGSQALLANLPDPLRTDLVTHLFGGKKGIKKLTAVFALYCFVLNFFGAEGALFHDHRSCP